MSELSMHELEAQTGEVLPEREALSTAFVFGSRNHVAQVDNHNTINNTTSHFTTVTSTNSSSSAVTASALSSSHSSANQTVTVVG